MLRWLSRKLGEIQCRTLLGQTARLRARQILGNNPGLSEKDAQQIASGEAVASLRGEGVDATSLTEVSAWSRRFLAVRDRTAEGQAWSDIPKGCDLLMTAAEITDMLKMTEREAAEKGETAYYKPDFLKALSPFLENPSLATAAPLLQVAPFLRSYFENCSPGGEFYEMRRLLGER